MKLKIKFNQENKSSQPVKPGLWDRNNLIECKINYEARFLIDSIWKYEIEKKNQLKKDKKISQPT